jgi:hypothetical protein
VGFDKKETQVTWVKMVEMADVEELKRGQTSKNLFVGSVRGQRLIAS